MNTKIILYICLLVSIFNHAQNCPITSFDVALSDDSGSDTNIRVSPNGEIILKLNKLDDFVLKVIDYKDNWLKIYKITSVNYGYEISELNGWIHQTKVGLWTRKEINLLTDPLTGNSVGIIEGEKGPVKVEGVCNDWIKIEYEGLIGWVELEWLCGNPVTTCP